MSGIMNMLLGARTAIAAAVDEFFNRVTLLLPGDGTNGAQNNTFLDSSTNNFTITRNGNTTQGTFSPFSQTGWSNYFDQSSRFSLNRAASSFGTNDFTIECWWLANGSQSNYAGIIAQEFSSTNGGWALKVRSTSDQVEFSYINSTPQNVTASSNVNDGAWHHIAVTRSGTSLRIYIDGTLSTTGTLPSAFSFGTGAGNTDIGYQTRDNAFIRGYVSNLRLVNGTALSTGSTYTVSTTPLTAVTNTSLLTCQSNRFIDNSSNAYAITVAAGAPSVQAFSPFAPTAAYSAATVGGSGYFDGTGDYLTWGPGSSIAFGTGDFTVETWIYPTGTGNYYIIDARNSGQTGAWAFHFTRSTNNVTWFNGSADWSVTASVIANQWNHIAYVRSGTTGALYLNGSRISTQTDSTNYSVSPTTSYIGTRYSIEQLMLGYTANTRILKGTAQYSGTTYTVPTAPLTAITNTQLLTNFTNAGITDATAKNDLETVGNAQISTTQSKFGGASIAFDGSGDYLAIPETNNALSLSFELFRGDFTIEFWFRANSVTGNQAIIVKFNGNASARTDIQYLIGLAGSSLNCNVYQGVSNNDITFTSAISTNTWYHVALVRSGTSVYAYLDGTRNATIRTISGDLNSGTTWGLNIGRYTEGGINQDFNGYIDDLRITKYARYSGSSFTVPTAAFPLQ